MCSLCASWLSDALARGGAAERVRANAADDRPTAVREQIPADSPTNRRRHRYRNACALFLPLGLSASASSFLRAESDVHVRQTLKRYLARQAPALLQRHPPAPGAVSGRTPLQAYSARVKARPAAQAPATHFRVRQDKVDRTGTVTLRDDSRLYKIGIGSAQRAVP